MELLEDVFMKMCLNQFGETNLEWARASLPAFSILSDN